ncbi:MAG TPA: excinuclease ABC subunit UvrC [Candidatus Saccharimonadales bacterium]|nr:excinuclease ABC subunit UvrC [Candidatus Saccharimonadales bacterium]
MVPTKRAERLLDDPALLKARLRASPSGAGVYVMRGADARVIYVGKAANVRNRLRSWFTGIDTLQARTHQLIASVFDFEVIACQSEHEALVLENSLIKRHRPRFNVRLKDDKSYLYLKIPRPGVHDAVAPGTAREEVRRPRGKSAEGATLFPRPYYTRKVIRDGARYFGPYTSAQSLRTTVRSLRTIFPFRTCSDEIFRRGRVCLDYHIKRCSGPCEGRIDAPEYAEVLEQVQEFMEGRSEKLHDELRDQMDAAAEGRDYELAARFRDRLRAIERISERQTVLRGVRADEDCIAVVVEAGRAMAAVLSIRQGRVMGMETHELEGVTGLDAAACLAGFLPQYYGSVTSVPRRLLVSDDIEGRAVLEAFLAEQRGGPVEVHVPQRGDARRLVAQAAETALVALRQQRIVDDYDAAKTEALLDDLATSLQLPAPPRRIECYDISNTMGTNSVGSMVVFEEGRPAPASYRHFGIKTVEGANDFASIEETLRRRFRRLVPRDEAGEDDVPVLDPAGANGAEQRPHRTPRRAGDDSDLSFSVLPDLVLIDGGKGQLSAAVRALREAGLQRVPVFGLAKRNEELYKPGRARPIILERDSPTLFLVQRVRDEAHRFAITHHRGRRAKAALRSKLDVVPGLGPVRRRALLRQFGSIDGIRDAPVDQLTTVVPRPVALRVKELL